MDEEQSSPATVGVCPSNLLREDVMKAIDNCLIDFCNAYLAANRQGPPTETTRQAPIAPRGAAAATSDRGGASVGSKARTRGASPPSGVRQSGPRQVYLGLGQKHWVKEKIDRGAFIQLEDRSLWQISRLDRIDTTLWLPMQDVVVIENPSGLYPYKLISEGDAVEATLIVK